MIDEENIKIKKIAIDLINLCIKWDVSEGDIILSNEYRIVDFYLDSINVMFSFDGKSNHDKEQIMLLLNGYMTGNIEGVKLTHSKYNKRGYRYQK